MGALPFLLRVCRQNQIPTSERWRLLSRREVIERTSLSYPTLWRWMIDGKFPRSRQVGGKCCWVEAEIDRWIATAPLVKLKGDTP
jgi:prophage regulatory protein